MKPSMWVATIGVALSGCTPSGGRASPEAGSHPLDAGPAPAERLAEAEDRRNAAGVTEDDVGSHDVAVRRRAARALARIGGDASLPLLFTALSDEDADVVAWAAYGLGYVCRTEPSQAGDVTRALATRAASAPPAAGTALDPTFALARALGRCPSDDAEKILETWLAGPRPRAAYAALALGDVASRKKTLAEPTQLSLLTAAAAGISTAPLAEALHPFGRFDHPLASATDRLLEVATARLSEAGAARVFAVRALSRAERGAAPELGRVLTHADTFTPAERAEAARGLGRLGDAGQRALADALPSLVPARDPLAMTVLGTSAFGPLLVALQSLNRADLLGLKKPLYDLATLALPADPPPTLARRVAVLRCRAASLLVNGAAEDALLVGCDHENDGEIGQRAKLEVLGRRPIRGRHLAIYRALAASSHVRVREAAVELLAAHPEIDDAPAIVADALGAQQVGLVATAAEFVTAHPDRVSGRPKSNDADVAGKLAAALERSFGPDDVETVGDLIEAVGAIRLASASAKIESYCGYENATVREHAARALSLLKSSKTTCKAAALGAPARELAHLVSAEVKLGLETDAGELELVLDPTIAPIAVTRFTDLARAGFYDGIVIHRVVPGFVAQFGDPGGDGFGGPGRDPLRCETTPRPFDALSVGVALAGRDTGSSQLFVTLARQAHLDGEYAWVGRASGDWDSVAEGDVIRKVKVR